MKRKEILKRLSKLGFDLKEGGNHTKIYKNGHYVSALSRQAEIDDRRVLEMEKQIGAKLR
ncbi:MAG: hypothetical protein R3Y11_01850 [Pseudomonadota bacterium]